jgi:non-specific serine/threonine protein kinase
VDDRGPDPSERWADVTTFVGRKAELRQIRRLLADFRLLTLTGVGGVGKTRLALRAGAEMRRSFADGVKDVDLARLTDNSLVTAAISSAVGLRDDSRVDAVHRLVGHLADKRMLIVLDNCEHVLDSLSPLVDRLLRSCPGLHLLATSRQPLGVDGECTLCLSCLPVPGDSSALSLTECLQYDAVRLFVDRATAALPDLACTPAAMELIVEICQRLDGLPLAIELAAVRIRGLSLQELLDRLADRFAILTGGSRAALPRQQTLRALIEWSYELLTVQERLLWARLTVFAGSFTLPAVEGICTDEEIRIVDVPDLVAGLVEKSVLVREDHDGRARYRMLESLRMFGRVPLVVSGEADHLEERLHGWYLATAERYALGLFGPRQVQTYRELRADYPNIRTGLEQCAADPNLAADGLRITNALIYFWVMDGAFREGYHWCTLFSRMGNAPAERVRGLAGAIQMALPLGDFEGTQNLLAEAEVVLAHSQDPRARNYILLVEFMILVMSPDAELDIEARRAAVGQLLPGPTDEDTLARTTTLASQLCVVGDYIGAEEFCRQAEQLSARMGEQWWGGVARWTRGIALLHRGELGEAEAVEKQSIQLLEPFGDRFVISLPLQTLAMVISEKGNHEIAVRMLGTVDALRRAIGATTEPQGFGPERTACIDRARSVLGEQLFALTYEAGLRTPPEIGTVLSLAGAGVPTPPPAGAATHAVQLGALPELTNREREIAALVAAGLSNRQIAAKLVIAQRTAEGHIERMLSKLGLHSRRELTAWYLERTSTVAPSV